jgi:cysteinyl-tRNA synthetase
MKYLGETFDIHGGGKDLIFPHHENEIAQSEAATGRPFVRYWLHNGFVNINAEKMSKSLGNFFTIKEVLEKYDSELLRFFLLSAHYRSPLDFSDQNLTEAEAGMERIYKSLAGIDEYLASGGAEPATAAASPGGAELELQEKAGTFMDRFREALDDDFNTALAIGNLFDLVRSINRVLAETGGSSGLVGELLAAARGNITEMGGVLGLFTSDPALYLEGIKGRKVAGLAIAPEEIDRLVAERNAARKARDFARSDEIRDTLLARGIELLDGAQGTTWKVK